MIALFGIKVVGGIFILCIIGYLIFDWIRTQKSQKESPDSDPHFRKAFLAWCAKSIINVLIILMAIAGIMCVYLFSIEMYHITANGVPKYSYSLPFSFEVKSVETWKQGQKADGVEQVDIHFATGQIAIKGKAATYLFFLYVFINSLYLFLFLYLLRKILHSLSVKKPFVEENAVHIRTLAVTIIVFELLQGTIELCCYIFIHHKYEFNTIDRAISLDCFSLEAVFFGLVLLVIAEVFKCGAELKEESQLTI